MLERVERSPFGVIKDGRDDIILFRSRGGSGVAIVEATTVSTPCSTRNQQRQRDPEMHQTRKGNRWYFAMKAHVGVDRKTTLIHLTAVRAANEADWRNVLADLLRGDETAV